MRILLTGRNGQVGSELARVLPDAIAVDRAGLDLANADSIRQKVREAKPEIIINAAAYTAVDKAESERDLAKRVNALAPGVLGEEAKRLGALLVHYSTDYVFDGEKRTPYTEDDAPNPISYYARTKFEGERAITASGCRYLILRISWVYGPRASNFYQVIARKAAAGEPMRMVDDQTSVPTPSSFVAKYTPLLLKHEGVLHLVPSGQATRYEFAWAVVRAMRSRSNVERARTTEFRTPARRPVYSVLDNGKLNRGLGVRMPQWQEGLAEVLERLSPGEG